MRGWVEDFGKEWSLGDRVWLCAPTPALTKLLDRHDMPAFWKECIKAFWRLKVVRQPTKGATQIANQPLWFNRDLPIPKGVESYFVNKWNRPNVVADLWDYDRVGWMGGTSNNRWPTKTGKEHIARWGRELDVNHPEWSTSSHTGHGMGRFLIQISHHKRHVYGEL